MEILVSSSFLNTNTYLNAHKQPQNQRVCHAERWKFNGGFWVPVAFPSHRPSSHAGLLPLNRIFWWIGGKKCRRESSLELFSSHCRMEDAERLTSDSCGMLPDIRARPYPAYLMPWCSCDTRTDVDHFRIGNLFASRFGVCRGSLSP